jgi:hypothetical protein
MTGTRVVYNADTVIYETGWRGAGPLVVSTDLHVVSRMTKESRHVEPWVAHAAVR